MRRSPFSSASRPESSWAARSDDLGIMKVASLFLKSCPTDMAPGV